MKPGPQRQQSILGISFDGLAISGIVNEFLNLASTLRGDKLRILFDFGYDITMGRTKNLGNAILPRWAEEIRCLGESRLQEYSAPLVEEAQQRVASGESIAGAKIYDKVRDELAGRLAATFAREQARLLVIENGTLPDNPLYTEALYKAIDVHGARHDLGKYVLWRDHDLMWSAEPFFYGEYPYPGVRKPRENKHIHYAVTTEWMRKRMQAWAPLSAYHVMPNRFSFPALPRQSPTESIRARYNIPRDAYLIARCTRVVPQKSIDRDLLLLEAIQLRLAASSERRDIYLFVTGPTNEDPLEFERLRALEQSLSIAGQVVWGDGLLPFNMQLIEPTYRDDRVSVRDLLAEADLSSFLTTYDYEGFGNPPGEAMAMGVPFISTTYELYHEVYGSKGAIAPLLPISRTSSSAEPIPETFIDWTMRVMTDREYREQVVRRNLEVCERFFSLDALERQAREMFGSTLE